MSLSLTQVYDLGQVAYFSPKWIMNLKSSFFHKIFFLNHILPNKNLKPSTDFDKILLTLTTVIPYELKNEPFGGDNLSA